MLIVPKDCSVRQLAKMDERTKELARMLSGSKITEAALKHAETMLKQAGG